MISPGYYDIAFPEEQTPYDEFGVEGPTVTVMVFWVGSRVLMVDGADLIIEHYPVGWKPGAVLRRIDRVQSEWAASMTFKKVEVASGL